MNIIQKFINWRKSIKFTPLLIDKNIDNENNTIYRFTDPIKNVDIIYVRVKIGTGQIGLLDVNKNYRRQGLGTWTIKYIERELILNGVNKVWVACSKDHYYWSKLPNFNYNKCVHQSVTGGGYSKILSIKQESPNISSE